MGGESVLDAHTNLSLEGSSGGAQRYRRQLCKQPKPLPSPPQPPAKKKKKTKTANRYIRLSPSLARDGKKKNKTNKNNKTETVTSAANTLTHSHTRALRLEGMPLCVIDERQTRLQPSFRFTLPFNRPFGIMHESRSEND